MLKFEVKPLSPAGLVPFAGPKGTKSPEQSPLEPWPHIPYPHSKTISAYFCSFLLYEGFYKLERKTAFAIGFI
jgi:hypothetical protein